MAYVALDTARRLEVALKGVAILRGLAVTNRTMTYADFARSIGLLGPREAWKPWHRQQVSDTLYLIGAVAAKAGDRPATERIVNAGNGAPGAGQEREPRIVVK